MKVDCNGEAVLQGTREHVVCPDQGTQGATAIRKGNPRAKNRKGNMRARSTDVVWTCGADMQPW